MTKTVEQVAYDTAREQLAAGSLDVEAAELAAEQLDSMADICEMMQFKLTTPEVDKNNRKIKTNRQAAVGIRSALHDHAEGVKA